MLRNEMNFDAEPHKLHVILVVNFQGKSLIRYLRSKRTIECLSEMKSRLAKARPAGIIRIDSTR